MLAPLNPGTVEHRGPFAPAQAELVPVSVGDRLFVLDAHTLDLFRATPELVRALSHAPPEVIGRRSAPLFRPPRESFPPCRTLVLNLTHACNLRCRYCFVREQQGDRAPASMPRDLAVGAVDALLPPGTRGASVGFFGGEPLMAWGLLCEIADHCEDRGLEARHHVTTNAALLDADRASWFSKRRGRFSFIVSIDGDPARHDRLRPKAGGAGSYDDTLAGLEALCRVGFRPTLRSTFTAEGCDLADELERLNALCDDGLGGHVSVEPVSLTEGCVFGAHALTPAALLAMEPAYEAAADWFISRARGGRRARFHHLDKTLERLILHRPYCTECGAGRAYLTVSPTAEIHACHREKSPIGRMMLMDGTWRAGFDARREAWHDNRLEIRKDCPSCGLRYVCGGGCRQDAMDRCGEVREPSPLNCALTAIKTRMAIRVLDEIGPDAAARAAGIRKRKSCRKS